MGQVLLMKKGGGLGTITDDTPTTLTGMLKGNGADIDVAEEGVDYAAPSIILGVTIPTEGWSSNAPYTIQIEVPGVLEIHHPITTLLLSDDAETRALEREAFGCISLIKTYDGYIDVICDEVIPSQEIHVRLITTTTATAINNADIPVAHNHDDRYYTETEVDTKFAEFAPPTVTYEQLFAIADWASANSLYTITIPAATHGKGASYIVGVYEKSGDTYTSSWGAYTDYYWSSTIAANGDLTLTASAAFDGKVVLV